MARNLNNKTLAEITNTSYVLVNLIEFYIVPGEPTYLTDAAYDLLYDTKTYISTNGVLSIDDIREEDQLNIESVAIGLTAIKSENVKLFLDYDYIDRRVVIYRAALSDQMEIIGSPFLVFDGRMDQPSVKEDFASKTATMSVTASSHWTDFDSTNGRHTNDSEQQVLFPGDKFFEFATDSAKDIKWGRE